MFAKTAALNCTASNDGICVHVLVMFVLRDLEGKYGFSEQKYDVHGN